MSEPPNRGEGVARLRARQLRILGLIAGLVVLVSVFAGAPALGQSELRAAAASGTYEGETDQGDAVTLSVSGDGTRISRLRIDYTVTCDDGRTVSTYSVVQNVPVTDDTFEETGTYTGAGDGSENRFIVAGTFDGDLASGTFDLTATGEHPETGERVTCQTGTIGWSATNLNPGSEPPTPTFTRSDAAHYAKVALRRKFRSNFQYGYGKRVVCRRKASRRFTCRVSWFVGDLTFRGRVGIWTDRAVETWYYNMNIVRTNGYCRAQGRRNCSRRFVVR
jgi:hypothetical protein